MTTSAQWDPASALPITDARTLRKFIFQAGVVGNAPPTASQFVPNQLFLRGVHLREALVQELERITSTTMREFSHN